MNTLLQKSMTCVGAALLTLTVTTTALAQVCAQNVEILKNVAPYQALFTALNPRVGALTFLVGTVVTAPTVPAKSAAYNNMVNQIQNVFYPTIGASPRLLLAESDGTVLYDSAQKGKTVVNSTASCGPIGVVPTNSYASFCSKQVNENHNSRIAILDAQLFPCGRGLETKFSTSVNKSQAGAAVRLGAYLNNRGTARYSVDLP